MDVYLRAKIEVSSIILTSFRWGGGYFWPPPPQNETLKSPPRLGLISTYAQCLKIQLERQTCYEKICDKIPSLFRFY